MDRKAAERAGRNCLIMPEAELFCSSVFYDELTVHYLQTQDFKMGEKEQRAWTVRPGQFSTWCADDVDATTWFIFYL